MLLFGNAHLLTGTIQGKTPHGLLATLCPILFWAALAAAGWLFYKRRNLRPLPRSTRDLTAFTVIWLGAVLASFSAFPRLPDEFMARYVTGALIPTGILVALLFNRAIGTLHKPMWTVPLVSLLVLAHGTVNFQHIRSVRDSLGQIMVAYGHARESISHTLRNSDIFILDFTYAYRRDLNDGNRYIKYTNASFSPDLTRPLYVLASIQGNPNRPNFAEIAQRISTHFPNLPRNHVGKQIGLRPVTVSSGLTDGIYNHWIYQNPQTISAVLFQVIFDPAALQEGTQP